jgi:hypothetical protein
MHSSFDLAISRLAANGTDATSLGLAGFEYGLMDIAGAPVGSCSNLAETYVVGLCRPRLE